MKWTKAHKFVIYSFRYKCLQKEWRGRKKNRKNYINFYMIDEYYHVR